MSETDTSPRIHSPGSDVLLSALEEAERHQPEGCMVLRAVRDGSGRITDFEWIWANPAAARALGCSPETLRGRRLREVSADDGLGGRVDVLREVVETGRPAADSFPEGEAWLQGTAVPLRDGVLLRLRDVTSALRVEEGVRDTLAWVRDVLEGTPDAFFTVDADWRVTYVNHQAAAISGRTQEQLFRRVLWEACPELLGTRMERELRRVATDGASTTFEVRVSPHRWHEVHAWCSNGNLSVFGTDITGKKHLEAERDMLLAREHSGRLEAEALVQQRTEELVAARERLVRTEKLAMAGQLAAGVSHEINNPLSYVTGNIQFAVEQLEMLAQNPGDTEALSEALDALREAREGAERIRVTVRDLQTFARADEPHLSPVDVHGALEFSLSMAMPHLRYRAQVERHYATVPTVMAHEARLGQVFLQLLVNASHALPEGDAERHRIILTSRAEGAWVVVEVTDTGHGMAPEVLERVFEPFFTTRPVGSGTGLGLSTALGLVRSMRGELTATSTPGGGSTFRVRLPTTYEDARPASAEVAPEKDGEPRRVLVVDDEPQVAAVLRRVLGGRHEVVLVHSGREALDLLARDEAFDRIFCDLMMGEVTGMDLYAELGRRQPELLSRFVFMTGGGFTERARSFLQTVPLPRIEKPFEPGTVRALVECAPPRGGLGNAPPRAGLEDLPPRAGPGKPLARGVEGK
ncbi:PAS domain-containing protein [Pyxidicoccus parkwayensis]|uniref:histidine kinase n=1 Tax=Pyxidicoccus parkwayensis TaxID=2813578 RepID=A0ABX7NU67_9BACT|nr:ATP-binding protein [Pyxidicoccus parkwaysis]QSQ21055.1 PAS domain-containing protein [Pyxidicoccus parkwaysis]